MAKEKGSDTTKFVGSIYPSDKPLPDDFVKGIQAIENCLEKSVWMLIQNSDDEHGMISRFTYDQFFSQRENIKRKDVALLIESPGGYPDAAYKLAKLFYNRAGGFTALVPGYAKSAATLICLGANQIILGEGGELGPLDMQTKSQDDEEMSSALNHVQTLERLRAFSLTTLDETVQLMLLRTKETLIKSS